MEECPVSRENTVFSRLDGIIGVARIRPRASFSTDTPQFSKLDNVGSHLFVDRQQQFSRLDNVGFDLFVDRLQQRQHLTLMVGLHLQALFHFVDLPKLLRSDRTCDCVSQDQVMEVDDFETLLGLRLLPPSMPAITRPS